MTHQTDVGPCGPQAEQRILLFAGDCELSVGFSWVHDRFTHALTVREMTDRENRRPIAQLQSCEGTDRQNWPPSPPLQQLDIQELPSIGRAGLLVGKAGRAHWSVSATAETESQRLAFDVACRVPEPPEFLGSTYTGASIVRWDSPNEAILAAGDRPLRLILQAAGDQLAATATQSTAGLEIRPQFGQLAPPITIRWRYCFQLER